MILRESTLAAVEEMNKWADYMEVYNYMKENGYFVGNSKTPERSVASELYKHAEAGRIERKKERKQPIYKKKNATGTMPRGQVGDI